MALGTPVSLGTGTGTGTSATQAMTCAVAVAVGDKVHVFVGSSTSGRVLSSVTDSQGNTYTIDRSQNTGGGSANAYIASAEITNALTTSDTITATWASSISSTRHIAACSVSGEEDSSPVDQANGEFDTAGTDFATPNITTAVADTITFGMFHSVNAGTVTFNAPATELFDFNGGSRTTGVCYEIRSATATFNQSGTLSAGGAKEEAIVAYKGAGVAPPATGLATRKALLGVGV
jgi:hypothetical protein